MIIGLKCSKMLWLSIALWLLDLLDGDDRVISHWLITAIRRPDPSGGHSDWCGEDFVLD